METLERHCLVNSSVAAASVLPNSKSGGDIYNNPSMHLVQYLSLCRRRRGIPQVYPNTNPAAAVNSLSPAMTTPSLPVLRGAHAVFQADPFASYAAASAARGAAVNAAAVNAAAAAAAAEMYHLPGGYAANAAYSAAAARYYTGAAAQAVNPATTVSVAYPSPASAAGLHALPTDPFLGHSIGPVAGYGPGVYRNTFNNRFAPY